MIDYGHICLLIFAQGTWKESYRQKFLKKIENKFRSSLIIDDRDLWAEIEIIPPFDPKDPKNKDKLCKLCSPLYEILEEKKGVNDGLIVFTHNIIGWKEMKNFLLYIFGEVKVKKIYYLELDWTSYTTETEKRIPNIINNIQPKQINRNNFFDLFDKEEIKLNNLYEVIRH